MGSSTSKAEIASWSEQVVARHLRGINGAFARYADALEEIGGFNGEALLGTTETDLEPIFADLGVKHLHKVRLRAEFKKLQQLTEISPEQPSAGVGNYLHRRDDGHRTTYDTSQSISSSKPSIEICSPNSTSGYSQAIEVVSEPSRSTPHLGAPSNQAALTPATTMPSAVMAPVDATLAIGSRCAALFASGSEWYPGVVSGRRRSRGVMTYSIEYDDGDVESSVAAGLVRALPQDLSPDDAEAHAAVLSSGEHTVCATEPLDRSLDHESSNGRASPLQAVLAKDGKEAWELSAQGVSAVFSQAQLRRRALDIATAAETPSDPSGSASGPITQTTPPPKPLPREMLQNWNKNVPGLPSDQRDTDIKVKKTDIATTASSEAVPKRLPKEIMQSWNKTVSVTASSNKDSAGQRKASLPRKANHLEESSKPLSREKIQSWNEVTSVSGSGLEDSPVRETVEPPAIEVSLEEFSNSFPQKTLQVVNSALPVPREETLTHQKAADAVETSSYSWNSNESTPLPSVAPSPPPKRGDRRRSREAAPARAPPPPFEESLPQAEPASVKAEEISLTSKNEEQVLQSHAIPAVVAKDKEEVAPCSPLEIPAAPRRPRKRYPGAPPPAHPSTFKGLGREKFKALFSNARRLSKDNGGGLKVSSTTATGPATAANFDIGAAVWVSDPVSAFVAGSVTSVVPGGSDSTPGEGAGAGVATVTLVGNGKVVDVQAKSKSNGSKSGGIKRGGGVEAHFDVLPREGIQGGGSSNMDNLGAPHAAAVLENVDTRFRHDQIYTSTGPILIALNPFCWLPLYGESVMRQYLRASGGPTGAYALVPSTNSSSGGSSSGGGSSENLPPHIFAVAQAALANLHCPDIITSSSSSTSNDRKSSIVEAKDQVLVICGESGAGKTETTKLVMQYLAFASTQAAKGKLNSGKSVADCLVESSPLLEAFGNAKTRRNDNSSRFGKFTTLEYCLHRSSSNSSSNSSGDSSSGNSVSNGEDGAGGHRGCIRGAHCANLLLEASRVTAQAHGERNYHVFYQLLRASPDKRHAFGVHDDALCSSWSLASGITSALPSDFWYLNQRNFDDHDDVITDVDDGEEFIHLIESMSAVSISEPQQGVILRLVASLLCLGNVRFEPLTMSTTEGASPGESLADGDDSAAQVVESDTPMLATAARLLGLGAGNDNDNGIAAAEQLGRALVTRVREVPGGEKLASPNSPEDAAELRDALAKVLYSHLFDWIIAQVNAVLKPSEHDDTFSSSNGGKSNAGASRIGTIGLLDIFGFEDMASNGFEQLCINTTNEALQQVFNDVVFRAEAAAYDADGIDWDPTTFPDNTAVVDLLSAKPLGLLPMLDSQCSRGHAAGDGAVLVRAYAQAHTAPSPLSSGPNAARRNSILDGGHSNDHSGIFTAGGLSSGLRKGGGEEGGTTSTLQRTTESDFAVTHYAGVVVYSAEEFIGRNRNALYTHVPELLQSHGAAALTAAAGASSASSAEEQFLVDSGCLLAELFPRKVADGVHEGGTKGQVARGDHAHEKHSQRIHHYHEPRTVASTFLEQLAGLRASLKRADSMFVRCIKTNAAKEPGSVDRVSVLRQLVCGGVIAALEVRRAGFPQRMAHDAFCREFTVLETATDASDNGSSNRSVRDKPSLRCQDDEELAVELLLLPAVQQALSGVKTATAAAAAGSDTMAVVLDAFRPGKTTLFFRADTLFTLRQLRAKLLAPVAVKLQRWWFALQGAGELQRRFRLASRTVQRASTLAAAEGISEVPAVREALLHAESALAHAKPAVFAAVAAGIFASALSSPSRRLSNSPNQHHLSHSGGEGSNSTATELIRVEKDAETCWNVVVEAIAARAEVRLLHASRLKEIDACQGRAQIILNAASNLLSNHARAKLSGLALEAIFAAKHARFAYRTQLQQWRAAHAGILGAGVSSSLLGPSIQESQEAGASSSFGAGATLTRQRRGSVFGVGAAAVAAAATSVASRKEKKRLARMTASLAAAAEAHGVGINQSVRDNGSSRSSSSSFEQNELGHEADQGNNSSSSSSSSSSRNSSSSSSSIWVASSLMGRLAAKKLGKSWKRTAHARASMSLESWVLAAQSKVEAAEAEMSPCLVADEDLRNAVIDEEPRLEAAALAFGEGAAVDWHELEAHEDDFCKAIDVRAAVEAAHLGLCHARDAGSHSSAIEYHTSCDAALAAIEDAALRIEEEQQRRAMVADVRSATQRIMDMQLETTQDPELADPGYLTASAPELARALELAVVDASELCTDDADFHQRGPSELEEVLGCLEAHVTHVEGLLAAAQKVMAAERRDRFNRFKSAFEAPPETLLPHHHHPVHVSPAIERLKAQKCPLISATLNGPILSVSPAAISATFTGSPPTATSAAPAAAPELLSNISRSDDPNNSSSQSYSGQSSKLPNARGANSAALSQNLHHYADDAQSHRVNLSDNGKGDHSFHDGRVVRDNSFAALSDIAPDDGASYDAFNDLEYNDFAGSHNHPRPATPPDDEDGEEEGGEEGEFYEDDNANSPVSSRSQQASPQQWPSFESVSVTDSPSKFLPGLFSRNGDTKDLNRVLLAEGAQEDYNGAAIDSEVEAATNAAAVAIQDEYSLNNLVFDDESPLELFESQDGNEGGYIDNSCSPEEIFDDDENIEDVEDAESVHSNHGVAASNSSSFGSSFYSPIAPVSERTTQPASIVHTSGSQVVTSLEEPLTKKTATNHFSEQSTAKENPPKSIGSTNRASAVETISEERSERQRRQERRRERERRREQELPHVNSPSVLPGASKNSKSERERVVRLAVSSNDKSHAKQRPHDRGADPAEILGLERQKTRQKDSRTPRERSSSRNRPQQDQSSHGAIADRLVQHDRHPSSSRRASRTSKSSSSQPPRKLNPRESLPQSSALLSSPSTPPVVPPSSREDGTNENWASLDVHFRAMSQSDRYTTISGVELVSLVSKAAGPSTHGTSAQQRALESMIDEAAASIDLVLELTLPGALDEKQRPLAVKTTLRKSRRRRSSSNSSSGSSASGGASSESYDIWSTAALLGLGINEAAVADPAGKVKPRLELRLWARPQQQTGTSRVLLAACRKSLDLRAEKIAAAAAVATAGGGLFDPQFTKAMVLEGCEAGRKNSVGGAAEKEPVEVALLSAFLDVAIEPPEYLGKR